MQLSLSHPLKGSFITQKFGINGEYYRSNGIPVDGHNGQDWYATHGQPVYASHDGFVSYAGGQTKEGVGVVLITNEKFDSPTSPTLYKTIYWHLCLPTCHGGAHKLPVAFGQQVKRGDIIGYANNTGLSTGDHLHFGLKPVAEGESQWTWWNVLQNNGYGGAIDPAPFLEKPEAFPNDLFLGMTGEAVSRLQVFLITQKLLETGTFGFFGPKTFTAVKAFQTLHNIPNTGYVGRLTRAKINSILKA